MASTQTFLKSDFAVANEQQITILKSLGSRMVLFAQTLAFVLAKGQTVALKTLLIFKSRFAATIKSRFDIPDRNIFPQDTCTTSVYSTVRLW